VKARRKQLCDRTDLVQNQDSLAEIEKKLHGLRRTGSVPVFAALRRDFNFGWLGLCLWIALQGDSS
jgi:hypothetical protein